FFSSRRRHTRFSRDWSSDVCSSDLMFAYVILTAILFQKGSAESKAPGEDEAVDHDPRLARNPDRPWPVRRGGWILRLYEHSLSRSEERRVGKGWTPREAPQHEKRKT